MSPQVAIRSGDTEVGASGGPLDDGNGEVGIVAAAREQVVLALIDEATVTELWVLANLVALHNEAGPHGAVIVGGRDEVVDKIRHYDEVLGGITRLTFQMDLAALPHAMLMCSIGTHKVAHNGCLAIADDELVVHCISSTSADRARACRGLKPILKPTGRTCCRM